MKNVLLIITLMAMSMSFTSCSSSVVVDAKVKVAEKIGSTVEKELVKVFVKEGLEGCEAEAAKHGDYMYAKVAKLLKIEVPSMEPVAITMDGAPVAKSLTKTSLAQKACMFAMDKGLPYLFEKVDTSNVCLKKLGMVKAVDMGREVCRKIKL